MRKDCYSDLENLLKFKAEGREFSKFLRSLKQFIVPGLYILPSFFTAVYIVERLILQTIFVIQKEILQFLALYPRIYNQERLKSRVGHNGAHTVCIQTVNGQNNF